MKSHWLTLKACVDKLFEGTAADCEIGFPSTTVRECDGKLNA